jgi:hypothetical protein
MRALVASSELVALMRRRTASGCICMTRSRLECSHTHTEFEYLNGPQVASSSSSRCCCFKRMNKFIYSFSRLSRDGYIVVFSFIFAQPPCVSYLSAEAFPPLHGNLIKFRTGSKSACDGGHRPPRHCLGGLSMFYGHL